MVSSIEQVTKLVRLEGVRKLGVEHCLEAAGARRVASCLCYVKISRDILSLCRGQVKHSFIM